MNPVTIGLVVAATAAAVALFWRREMGQPGTYFTWTEMERSSTAARMGLDNTMDPQARARSRALVAALLDPLRLAVGRPIRITSGYRSPDVNRAVGGAPSSDHLTGGAADIAADGLTAQDLARIVVRLKLPYDQMIAYHPARGGHLHLSYRPGDNRGQTLYMPAQGRAVKMYL